MRHTKYGIRWCKPHAEADIYIIVFSEMWKKLVIQYHFRFYLYHSSVLNFASITFSIHFSFLFRKCNSWKCFFFLVFVQHIGVFGFRLKLKYDCWIDLSTAMIRASSVLCIHAFAIVPRPASLMFQSMHMRWRLCWFVATILLNLPRLCVAKLLHHYCYCFENTSFYANKNSAFDIIFCLSTVYSTPHMRPPHMLTFTRCRVWKQSFLNFSMALGHSNCI